MMAADSLSTVILPLAPRGEFRNEPVTDFRSHENARAMREALKRVGDWLGHEYELVIGGKRLKTAEKIRSVNPARPTQIVGVHQKAGAGHAEQAIEAALAAYETWRSVPVELRASLLLHAAEDPSATKI